MWQSPNQRVRAIQNAKKRQMDRLKRPMHLKKVRAEMKIVGPDKRPSISEARVVLNDMSPEGVGIFSSLPVLVGQEISLTMEDPRQVFLKGRVVWCQEFDVGSPVVSQHTFSYRMGIRFVFSSPKEQEAVRLFCEELFRLHLYGNAA